MSAVDLKNDFLDLNVTYTDGYVSHGVMKAIQLVETCAIWPLNRPQNEAHVEKLVASLTRRPYFLGVIQILQNLTGEYMVFDGQHRHRAIQTMLATQVGFDMPIAVHIYRVPSFTCPAAVKLFNEANAVLTFDQKEDNVVEKIAEVVTGVCDSFPGFIKDNKERSCNRPYMHKGLLYQALKKLNPPGTADEILKKILKINQEYSGKECGFFKGASFRAWGVASAKGFLLGLFKTFDWVKKLVEEN